MSRLFFLLGFLSCLLAAGCKSSSRHDKLSLYDVLLQKNFAGADRLLRKQPARINGEFSVVRGFEGFVGGSERGDQGLQVSFREGKPLLSVFADTPLVVKWLLSRGARVDMPGTALGNCPLHEAAASSFETTTLLVSNIENELGKGQILNTENKRGLTPLYLAIEAENYDTAEYLVSAGAEINYINRFGETMLDFVLNEVATVSRDALINSRRVIELREAETWIRTHGGKRHIKLAERWVKETKKQERLHQEYHDKLQKEPLSGRQGRQGTGDKRD